MRSRLRQLRLLFCALRYGFRLIWLAAPEHHKLHWFVTLASSLHGDRRLAARLHGSLPRLAPLAAAFAQTLASRPELAGATLHDAIDAIEHFEDPLSRDALAATLRAALGKPPETLLTWIDPTPAHNGWCEQTHVARLALPVNGHQTITLRVLRTQQVQEVDDDAALLCGVARWMERFSRAARRLQLHALAQALREDLQRRFDLRAQAANLSQSNHQLGDDPRIVVPDVIWDLCTAQTLAVQHIDTVRATNLDGLAEHHINVTQVAANLIEVVTRQAFEHGFFHAAFDARRVAVSVEPATRGRLVLAGASLMTSLSSPEREFFVHGAMALFEQDYGRLATLHHVAGHVSAHARTEQIEAELRTRSEAHFAIDRDERRAARCRRASRRRSARLARPRRWHARFIRASMRGALRGTRSPTSRGTISATMAGSDGFLKSCRTSRRSRRACRRCCSTTSSITRSSCTAIHPGKPPSPRCSMRGTASIGARARCLSPAHCAAA